MVKLKSLFSDKRVKQIQLFLTKVLVNVEHNFDSLMVLSYHEYYQLCSVEGSMPPTKGPIWSFHQIGEKNPQNQDNSNWLING